MFETRREFSRNNHNNLRKSKVRLTMFNAHPKSWKNSVPLSISHNFPISLHLGHVFVRSLQETEKNYQMSFCLEVRRMSTDFNHLARMPGNPRAGQKNPHNEDDKANVLEGFAGQPESFGGFSTSHRKAVFQCFETQLRNG